VKIDFRQLTMTSIVCGFLLIPVHELGHVIGDWMTGHPAGMSYARDYLLSGTEKPFLGILGGPLLPILLSAVSVVLIYRRKNISVLSPIAILGSFDRLVLYLGGSLPSDERDLAQMAGWSISSFKYIFVSVEVILLLLVLVSLFRYKVGFRQSVFVIVIPLVSFIVGASLGVFVIERYVFPVQFRAQFG